MPSTETITTNYKSRVKEHVWRVVPEVASRYGPLYYVWGYANKPGEHGKGLAIDFSILEKGQNAAKPGTARPKLGHQIAEYLWRNRSRLNVWYVIWNRRIISRTYESKGWRPYSGKSPHTDHVHVSFYANRTYTPPKPPEDNDDMPSAKEVAHAVLFSDVIENVDNKTNPKMTLAGAIADVELTQDKHGAEIASLKSQLKAQSAEVARVLNGVHILMSKIDQVWAKLNEAEPTINIYSPKPPVQTED